MISPEKTSEPVEPIAPYPGLRPFKAHEWSIFCGRERLVDDLIERLETDNLLLVHGGSGCGKSSLVIAGILPALQYEVRLEGGELLDATIRPSQGPFGALAAELAKLGPPDDARRAEYWAEKLMANAGIVPLIEARLGEQQKFCLIVDQFEEIFAWAHDRRSSDVEVLVRFLVEVSRAASTRLFVLVTIRSDFLGACSQYRGLSDIINERQYLLPALDEKGIARAIVEPARMFNGTVEPSLVQRLLIDAAAGSDPLPVLQHALMRMASLKMIEAGAPWSIDETDLAQVSGTTNPLSEHAEGIWTTLSDKYLGRGAEAMEWILRALFDIEKVKDIVGTFAADGNNLLVERKGFEGEGKHRVDISHEALLRLWSRINGTRAGELGLKQKEIEDALMWRGLAFSKRSSDLLGPQSLSEAERFLARMTSAPERGRRYLSDDFVGKDVRDSPDWTNIATLIARSKRRQRFVGAAALLLLASAVLGIGLAYRQAASVEQQAERTADSLASQSARLKDTVEFQREEALQPTVADPLADADIVTGKAVLDGLESTGATLGDDTAYMWIGDADTPILEPLAAAATYNGLPCASTAYSARYDIALRSSLPTLPNRMAPRVGLVRKGEIVCALGKPLRWEQSGQSWLHVRPLIVATVYVQTTSLDSPNRTRLVSALRSAGYRVPGVQRLPAAKGSRDIRFCNQDEGARLAPGLQRVVGNVLGGDALPTISLAGRAACASGGSDILELWLDNL
jgi:hypothetical protein